MGNSYGVRDAATKLTKALPNGAASTTPSAGIDLQNSSRGDFSADVEFLLSAPALTTGEAPDTRTCTYDIIHSDNADLSSPVTLMPGVIVQTGAGGAGAAAATYRFKAPTNVKRYLGCKATGGTSFGNASGKNMTLEALY